MIVLLLGMLSLQAQPPAGREKQFLRLAEEAEAFARLCMRVIGQETLEQVAAEAPPRMQQRGARPQTPFKTRKIVSEYGFTMLKDDPGNLHELRQVASVDEKPVKAAAKLRETLSMGQQTESDRIKKRLVREFESYGLREAATDFGQLILLFTKRSQANFTFEQKRTEYVGPHGAFVFAFAQKDGDSAMTVFEGKNVIRHKLEGELFLRIRDGFPLRVTLDSTRTIKDVPLRRYAIVDYQTSPHGLLLPVSVIYSESTGGQMLVENRFQYANFKMFGAESELKFTVEETPRK